MFKKITALTLALGISLVVGCTSQQSQSVSSDSTSSEPEKIADFVELTYYYSETINNESVVIPVSAPDQCLYGYDHLDENANIDLKKAYSEIVYAATHLSNPAEGYDNISQVYFSEAITAEQLLTVYTAILFDHPELWYLRQPDKLGCELHPDSNGTMAYLTYAFDFDTIKRLNGEIEQIADEIISGTSHLKNKIDKFAYLSGYIYDNCNINWTSYNETQHSSIMEMLIEKHGVCIGFATTLTYLMQRMGFFAITGYGKVESGMTHCWTIIEYNGVYTYTDNYYMDDKGGGTEKNIATYFNFDDINVYIKDHVVINEGILLPGYPVNEGVVQGPHENNDEASSSDTSSEE